MSRSYKFHPKAKDCPVCGGMLHPGDTCEMCKFSFKAWMEWRAIRLKAPMR